MNSVQAFLSKSAGIGILSLALGELQVTGFWKVPTVVSINGPIK